MKRKGLIDAVIRFGAAILICIVFAVHGFATGNVKAGLVMTGLMVFWIAMACWLYRLDRKYENELKKLKRKGNEE